MATGWVAILGEETPNLRVLSAPPACHHKSGGWIMSKQLTDTGYYVFVLAVYLFAFLTISLLVWTLFF